MCTGAIETLVFASRSSPGTLPSKQAIISSTFPKPFTSWLGLATPWCEGPCMGSLCSRSIWPAEDASSPELLQLINDSTHPETLKLFGLVRSHAISEFTDFDPQTEKSFIDIQETPSIYSDHECHCRVERFDSDMPAIVLIRFQAY
jgi:hypothetical protein